MRVGGAVSSGTGIENGTPQGSIISPPLFNVMINDIGTGLSLFTDDVAVWKSRKNMKCEFERMQGA